jgi:nicotinate-nucleotide adenylyltransferase
MNTLPFPSLKSAISQLRDVLRPNYTALKGKIGILGGTFDPPHLGHLAAAQHAKKACGLDALLFVPAKRNPLKTCSPQVSDLARLEMLALSIGSLFPPQAFLTASALQAAAKCQGFYLCELELALPAPSYTVDLLSGLRQQMPQMSALTFLLGADNLAALPRWKDIHRVFELAELVPMQRGAYSLQDLERDLGQLQGQLSEAQIAHLHAKYLAFDSPQGSSSAIRSGQSTATLVPWVQQYITENRLYL